MSADQGRERGKDLVRGTVLALLFLSGLALDPDLAVVHGLAEGDVASRDAQHDTPQAADATAARLSGRLMAKGEFPPTSV